MIAWWILSILWLPYRWSVSQRKLKQSLVLFFCLKPSFFQSRDRYFAIPFLGFFFCLRLLFTQGDKFFLKKIPLTFGLFYLFFHGLDFGLGFEKWPIFDHKVFFLGLRLGELIVDGFNWFQKKLVLWDDLILGVAFNYWSALRAWRLAQKSVLFIFFDF